jgi:hypothetical protein
MSMSEKAKIKALLPVEIDGQRVEPGKTADIRAELVDDLVACGAVEVMPAKAAKGG